MPRKLNKPLADESFITKVLNRTRLRSNVLGDLCSFDLNGVEIPPDKLKTLLDKHGLKDWAPVPIRRRTAARKAITRIRPTLESGELRVIVRPVHTNEPNVVRYAIVDETVDSNALDLDFSTRNQVVFRTDTGTLEFTGDVVPEILDMFDYLCTVYTDAEVKLMVKNIVTVHGCIWMNDMSGYFFMPHPLKDRVDSLVGLFRDLQEYTNQSCYFRPIAIMDDAENRSAMGEALIADITVELKDATDALDNAMDNESKKGLNAALQRFKVANGKAKLYKDMLSLNMDGITEQITEANRKAGELIVKMAQKKDTKDTDEAEETDSEDATDDND